MQSYYFIPFGSLITGGILGRFLTPLSFQHGATIGLINGLACTLISHQTEHKKFSRFYSIGTLALLILAQKTLPPLLNRQLKIPSTSSLILLAIPPAIFISLNRSTSPKTDTRAPQGTTDNQRQTKKKALIPKILTFFGVPFSKHLRKFPPVGIDDTILGGEDPNKKLQEQALIEELTSLLPPNHKKTTMDANFHEHTRIFTDSEKILAELLKKIYPETELYLLRIRGFHGYGLSYQDEGILSVSEVVRTEKAIGIEFRFSNRNKPILLQQGTRACTAACTAMLIYELLPSSFDDSVVFDLNSTNLGETENMISSLKRAGLTPIVTKKATLEEMQNLLSQYGSAIVGVNSGFGGHVVIVDEIHDDYVMIRDPYHGWEVTLTREAFEKSQPSNLIQVKGKWKS